MSNCWMELAIFHNSSIVQLYRKCLLEWEHVGATPPDTTAYQVAGGRVMSVKSELGHSIPFSTFCSRFKRWRMCNITCTRLAACQSTEVQSLKFRASATPLQLKPISDLLSNFLDNFLHMRHESARRWKAWRVWQGRSWYVPPRSGAVIRGKW